MFKIYKVKRRLNKIQQTGTFGEQGKRVCDLQQELCLILPVVAEKKELRYRIMDIHTWLQTEIMFSACKWAAVAAIFACISSVLALITVFSN